MTVCIPQLQFVEKRGTQVFMNIAYPFKSVWLHLLRLWAAVQQDNVIMHVGE